MNALVLMMFMGGSVLVGGINDAPFLEQLPHNQEILVATCHHGGDVRALLFTDGIKTPEFVEVSGGHVSRIARLSIDGDAMKVTDASGGLWTYERVHALASTLLKMPFHLVNSNDVKLYLEASSSTPECLSESAQN